MKKENIIDIYSQYASEFDKKIASLDLYNQSYTDFVNLATHKRNLLDLACGPGNVSLYIKNLVKNIKITCVDLADNMLELAKTKLIEGEFYKSDILDIQIPLQKYDLIVCAFGLPYIAQAQISKLASEIENLSQKETIVYLSCMQGNETKNETLSFANEEEIQIHYHTKETIIYFFKQTGFILIDYREQYYPEPDGTNTVDMIFIFKKV